MERYFSRAMLGNVHNRAKAGIRYCYAVRISFPAKKLFLLNLVSLLRVWGNLNRGRIDKINGTIYTYYG